MFTGMRHLDWNQLYKTMKNNFTTFAENTRQKLNLTMASGEHNGFLFIYFFYRCHNHQLYCKDCPEALIAKTSHCLSHLGDTAFILM